MSDAAAVGGTGGSSAGSSGTLGDVMVGRVATLFSGVSRAALGTAFSLTLFASAAYADEIKSFDIPRQEATTAVRLFGAQSGLQVLATVDDLKGKRVNAVAGKLDVHAALRQMLAGTGLTYRATDANTVLIEKPRATATPKLLQDSAASPPAAASQNPAEAPKEASSDQVEKVTVTGSRIRGARNKSIPVIDISREDIDKTGYSSTEQVVQSLPQNYTGGENGASEAGRFGSQGGVFNVGSSSGVNLRGLGTTSTLVLIDGHRVASAIRGTAVDISLIPLSAIERVEILTDGASAIYGSDAIAGVANFILRKDFEGAETRARYGMVTDGPTEEFLVAQAVGTNWMGGNALLNFQHRRRSALQTIDRDFSKTALHPNDLLPENEDTSAMFNARHELGDGFEIFGIGLYANRDSLRNFRSTLQTYSRDSNTEFYGLASGVSYDFGDDWNVELSGTYSEQVDLVTAMYTQGINPGYVNGTPEIDNQFLLWSADLQVTGSLFELPAGNVRTALGGTWREEEALYKTIFLNDYLTRSTGALFAEVYAPIVGEANAFPLFERLEFSAAVRYDDYSDFGDTINPRYGVFWSPMEDIGIRAAYSTSFRAPSVADQFSGKFGNFVVVFPFANPAGAPPTVPVFMLRGGGDPLDPETAESITAGITVTPDFWEGLTLTVEYFDIDFQDRIITPPLDSTMLLQPAIYGSLLTPLADDAAAAAYLNARLAEGYVLNNPFGFPLTGIRYAYNGLLQNAAHVQESGVDFRIAFPFTIEENKFSFQGNLAYISELSTAFTDNSTPVNILNTFGNPVQYRGRASLSWSAGEFGATAAANYSGQYRDTTAIPNRTVESYVTADLLMTYSPEALDNFTFNVSVTDLFDEEPPYVQGLVQGVHFDPGNITPLGRFVAVEVRTQW
jgi:iron complex outermembrane receptor protein